MRGVGGKAGLLGEGGLESGEGRIQHLHQLSSSLSEPELRMRCERSPVETFWAARLISSIGSERDARVCAPHQPDGKHSAATMTPVGELMVPSGVRSVGCPPADNRRAQGQERLLNAARPRIREAAPLPASERPVARSPTESRHDSVKPDDVVEVVFAWVVEKRGILRREHELLAWRVRIRHGMRDARAFAAPLQSPSMRRNCCSPSTR